MKIKTKKKLRLDELIKHIYDNDEANRVFIDDEEEFAVHSNSSDAAVNIEHLKRYGGKKCISKRDTFTVEVEEELTEETNLRGYHLKGIGRYSKLEDYRICTWPDGATNIKGIIKSPMPCDLKSLHVVNEDGVFTLIYTEEHGIPKDGVLEVSE